MGDTGGDHDLYDYCVDDPVSANDFSGLQGQRVWNENDHPRDDIGRFINKENIENVRKQLSVATRNYKAGKKLADWIATGGLYSAAYLADKIVGGFKGEESYKVRDGVKKALEIKKEKTLINVTKDIITKSKNKDK
ncbi:hypothetical protein SAMN02745728_01483 [Desulfovibrio litoralis DSM 11393]|uniref:Uncharacterized protein n=1 Tax=Desulfovibrio litoralis DSM 11393 TaxID=1121455 RepID=A0A1M7T2X3_9BACT|nr:hypothetical protein [Desulfovibrio litoralis]SHN65012.1 hypothetical protein SAMN02745728_01483 [Desulfovibrio litoralis DSM 11393]